MELKGSNISFKYPSAKNYILKDIDIQLDNTKITGLVGDRGSGKSTLAKGILYPALRRHLLDTGQNPGDHDGLEGDIDMLKSIEIVDQNPIGKSSRSNPAIYIKAWDEIRKLFAEQPYAKHNNITASHFSFNSAGGRCEVCQGEGSIKVSMQFMADITLTCEACNGKRFKDEVLEVKYRDKSVSDILDMSVDEAIAFFSEDAKECRRIIERLKTLSDVGLGYVKLGQPSSTLSGGESQRVKLASFLAQENATPTLFIFDEPTTGLHHHDVAVLLKALNALISRGHSVLVIEHNPSVILAADHIIDLGPEGGDEGGRIVAEGTPEQIMECADSYTGRALNELKDSFI